MSDAALTVSICIPAYNAAQFLPHAIETALGQEFDDLEVVVVDNASTDNTREVCEGYRDVRFRYEHEGTPGQASSWNRCIEEATGKYVILLHADDELRPQFLARTVEILESNPDVGLVNCAVEHIDEGGTHLRLQEPYDGDVVDRDGSVLRRLLLEGCLINPAGVLVRREAYGTTGGGFTDEVVWGVDWHMWIRIAMDWPVAHVAEPLARYRQHMASGTSGVMTSARNGKDEMWVLDDVFRIAQERRPELLKLRRDARHGVANRTWWMAERMCHEGEMGAARKGLRNAIAFRPALTSKPRTWALLAATFLGYDSVGRLQAGKRRSGGATANR